MEDPNSTRMQRLQQYLDRNGLQAVGEVGRGLHGVAMLTSRPSVAKAHEEGVSYRRERDSYLRLAERNVSTLVVCQVPRLIAIDDALMVIEMTVVDVPFCLDFGGAYVDRRPDYSEQTLADAQAQLEELFGDDFDVVMQVLASLRIHGIYLYDVHPGNVRLRRDKANDSTP